MRTEQDMLKIVLGIAKEDERIRAVYLFGSRANPNAKKDALQDYDVAFVVTETESFQADKNWLNAFGDIAMAIESERNALLFFGRKDMSALSRRCVFNLLFNDNNSLDLVLEIKDEAAKNFVEYKPNIILLDKDNFLSGISTATDENYEHLKPDENAYWACYGNFWWFMVYPAKGIARDRIPLAMVSFNSFTRTLLNRMIEWYIGVQTEFSIPIGSRERFYEKYLPKDIYALFSKTYTDSDYWNIVFVTCELFNKLALAVGTHFNFTYNQQEQDSMIKYLQNIKNNTVK
ncbi:MAG: aminoglycoside 6-adenylyltransferase [Defluviitaleaceae bacterium]|nr:aminoglycoside 6-adenylyltransferase [Defluviitaleaceae bacterium]